MWKRLNKWGFRGTFVFTVALFFLVGAAVTMFTSIAVYNREIENTLEQVGSEILNVLATSYASSQQAVESVERTLEGQMFNQARLLAEWLAYGDLTLEDVQRIADGTAIDEIWITDEQGVVTLTNNLDGLGWEFPDDPEEQAFPFRKLLESDDGRVAQRASVRSMDGSMFKYVGVSRPDKPGIVQVGISADGLSEIMEELEITKPLGMIVLEENDVEYAMILDSSDAIIYSANVPENSGEWDQNGGRGSNNVNQLKMELADGNTLVLGISLAALQQAQSRARNYTLGVGLLLLLVMLIVIWIYSRRFTQPILDLTRAAHSMSQGNFTAPIKSKGSHEIGVLSAALERLRVDLGSLTGKVVEASQSLKDSSVELSASTQETSASIQEVASTSTEFSASVAQMSENANYVADSASTVSEQVAEGERAIVYAIDQANNLQALVLALAEKVEKLGQRSQDIGKILDLISDISEKTNLLALNAAIEAARAGEQGRGFAVVADEVRNLAEQSSRAAGDISREITKIQQDTEEVVAEMQTGASKARENSSVITDNGKLLKRVLEAVNEITERIQSVANAAASIDAGSTKVAAATQQQSATIEQVATSADSLGATAEVLQELVSRFTVDKEDATQEHKQ